MSTPTALVLIEEHVNAPLMIKFCVDVLPAPSHVNIELPFVSVRYEQCTDEQATPLAVMLPELLYAHKVDGVALLDAFADMISFVVPEKLLEIVKYFPAPTAPTSPRFCLACAGFGMSERLSPLNSTLVNIPAGLDNPLRLRCILR